MAREINRLVARSVATLSKPGLHADGGGLYLRVDTGGAKRWVFIFRWSGARKEMGLGSTKAVRLTEARDEAAIARKHLANGRNPMEERRRRLVEGETFGAVADAMLAELAPTWRNAKHAYQWKQSLEEHAKSLRPLAVDAVTTEDVLRVLRPIWRTIPETASRTRGRIERVLDAAKAKGLRSGDNPARWRGHLSHLLAARDRAAVVHHPAMPYRDAPAFLARLRARPALSARALELTILTASRTRETLGARIPEFDLDAKVWTVPADRMKAGLEHRVALSDEAAKLVSDLIAEHRAMVRAGQRTGDHLFPGQKPGKTLTAESMVTLLKDRMGETGASVHGFRSTFKDWASETTVFPDELSEEALAHLVGSKVRRAYRRGDGLEKRRQLMQAWAGYLGRERGGNVRELRGA